MGPLRLFLFGGRPKRARRSRPLRMNWGGVGAQSPIMRSCAKSTRQRGKRLSPLLSKRPCRLLKMRRQALSPRRHFQNAYCARSPPSPRRSRSSLSANSRRGRLLRISSRRWLRLIRRGMRRRGLLGRSLAQEAEAIARRKVIYELKHPETKAGAAGAASRWDASDKMSFASATAEATGRDKKTIERAAARGKKLGADLKLIAGTALDKGAELDALKPPLSRPA